MADCFVGETRTVAVFCFRPTSSQSSPPPFVVLEFRRDVFRDMMESSSSCKVSRKNPRYSSASSWCPLCLRSASASLKVSSKNLPASNQIAYSPSSHHKHIPERKPPLHSHYIPLETRSYSPIRVYVCLNPLGVCWRVRRGVR